MDGVAEVGSAMVGSVAAGAVSAEGAVVASAPVVTATVESTAAGAVEGVTAASPVSGEAGVTTANVAVESSEAVAETGENVSDLVVGASAEEDNKINPEDSPAEIALKLNRKNLAEAQVAAESAQINNGSVFAKDQAAKVAADPEAFEKFHVPSAMQSTESYKKALKSVITGRGGDPEDVRLKNDKDIQLEAYWKYWHSEAEMQIEKKGGYIDHDVYGTKEWGEALILAHNLNDERKLRQDEPFNPAEISRITYTFYLEKKKKRNPLVSVLKGIGAFIVAGGQDAGKELKPELEGQPRRR
jgi:hypothetical protein